MNLRGKHICIQPTMQQHTIVCCGQPLPSCIFAPSSAVLCRETRFFTLHSTRVSDFYLLTSCRRAVGCKCSDVVHANTTLLTTSFKKPFFVLNHFFLCLILRAPVLLSLIKSLNRVIGREQRLEHGVKGEQ
jgi:hypothetical protein